MRVKFWGTRGSIPTPGAHTVRYGGNTSCVEVTTPEGGTLILDAGSGIRVLGLDMTKRPQSCRAIVLLSHVHWDHIQGFPFFGPAYNPASKLDIYGLPIHHKKIDLILSSQMEQMYFPVDLGSLRAQIRFHDLSKEGLEGFDARVKTMRVNHTTETQGFRIEAGGKSVVFIPDNELGRCGDPDRTVYEEFVAFCQGADLLIHDAQYTKATYKNHVGWGHSTFEEAVKLAVDAGVGRLALFHHDPLTTDDQIDERVATSRAAIDAAGAGVHCFGATEGVELDLRIEVSAGERVA